MDRRSFLGYGSAFMSVFMAGCSGSEENRNPTTTRNSTARTTTTTRDSTTRTTTRRTTDATTTERGPQPAIPEPGSVPEYSVEQTEDVSYANVVRYVVHVVTDEDVGELSHDDLLTIAKQQVHSITAGERVNAISVTFWGEDQRIRAESAFATCDWAPSGNWEDAGSAETGEYTGHEFILDGSPEFEILEFDAPNSVHLGEQFRVSLTVENYGIKSGEFSTFVSERGAESFHEVTATVDAKQTQTVESDPILFEVIPVLERATLTLSGHAKTTKVEIRPAILDVGDTFALSTHAFDVTITDFERGEVDEVFDDERNFYVRIRVENTSDRTQMIPGTSSFDLVTDGEEYSLLGFHDRDDYNGLVDVPPGESASGWLSDRLPKDTSRSDVSVRYSQSQSDGDVEAFWQ